MNINNLVISYLSVDKGSTQWHFGRKRRRKMKNTNIEIRVKESSSEKPLRKPSEKKEVKK